MRRRNFLFLVGGAADRPYFAPARPAGRMISSVGRPATRESCSRTAVRPLEDAMGESQYSARPRP